MSYYLGNSPNKFLLIAVLACAVAASLAAPQSKVPVDYSRRVSDVGGNKERPVDTPSSSDVFSGFYEIDETGKYIADESGRYRIDDSGVYARDASGHWQPDERGLYHDDLSWRYVPDERGNYAPDDSGLYRGDVYDARGHYHADNVGFYEPDVRGNYSGDVRGVYVHQTEPVGVNDERPPVNHPALNQLSGEPVKKPIGVKGF